MVGEGNLERPRKPFASEWTLTGFRVLDPRETAGWRESPLLAPATTNPNGLKHILDGGSNGIGRPREKFCCYCLG
jgi:hypothetical protein